VSVKQWKLGLKRCNCVECEAAITFEQTKENCGWVMWEHHKDEVTRLKAEVERLRIAGSESEPRFVLLSDYRHLKAETDNLKAEVERLDTLCKQLMAQHSDISCENIILRKAGDAMAKTIGENGVHDNGSFLDVASSIDAWYAAKEGKQP
jgi:hypothetical protein